MKKYLLSLIYPVLPFFFVACGGTSSSVVTDSSASGSLAGAIGGALAASNSDGTLASHSPAPRTNFLKIRDLFSIPEALAATVCPTLRTAAGSGCTQVNGTTVALTYTACSFAGSAATWTGIRQVTDTSTVTCGTFPTTTQIHQFVASAGGSASTGSRTSVGGTTVTIDDSTADLANYQGDTISTVTNAGYGSTVTWSGGVRIGVAIKERVYTTLFDHSLSGSVNVSEASGATTRTVSGSLTTYHNKAKVKGTSTFDAVGFENSCCFPTSGTISTAFAATSQSGVLGAVLDGKTERLTFTGCGTATLVGTDGATSNVALTHCL